jgi:hypothetical protein
MRQTKEKYEEKTYSEFQGTTLRLQKIFDEQMSDCVKNGVLKETPYEEVIYPAHLVPKANGEMSLEWLISRR